MAQPVSALGFQVVGLRFRAESKAAHQLLFKQHSVRTHSDSKPPDRTLFIVNVPPYCTEDSFVHLFSGYGKVRAVFFHKRPTSGPPPQIKHPNFASVPPVLGFKVAYVVFSHPSALKKALSLPPNTVLTLASDEHPVLTGVKKWQQEYNRSFVPRQELSAEVASVMADYDARKEREKAEGQQEPDSEGWVTVVSEKKKKPQLEKVEEVTKKKNSRKKKKKKQEIVHFYSFQQRQAKMDHLAQLRKKFEEDKNRITQMRMSRKFRPY